MTKYAPAFFTVVLLVAGPLRAEEHPFARAKVGDWAWYTTSFTSKTAPPTPPSDARPSFRRQWEEVMKRTEAAMKEPVVARLQVTTKTDTQVVVTSMSREFGRDYESRWTVDLTRPYQPFPTTSAPARELARGTEVLTLNGDRYETTWVDYEIEYDRAGTRVRETKRIWRSPNVPVDGMVRTETDNLTSTMVTELTSFGRDRPSGVPGGSAAPNR